MRSAVGLLGRSFQSQFGSVRGSEMYSVAAMPIPDM
jgi:hypothetical protein